MRAPHHHPLGRRLAATLGAVLVLALPLLAAAPTSASQIVYQCGAAVCSIDPDAGTARRVLTTSGTVAGVTDDGRTAGWVTGSSLVERSIAAGGLDRTLFSGEIYDFPRISPNGAQALWSFFLLDSGWYTYLAPSTGTGYPPAVASSTYQTTHGWMGASVLVGRRGYGANEPRLCEEVIGGPGCDTLLATEPDASTQVAFPDGRRDGGAIVAIRGPDSTGVGVPVRGRISLYSTPTKTRVRDLTTATTDAFPSFSYEGDRVAFERSGSIYVVATTGGAVRRIAAGTMPFWGGPRTIPPDPPDPPIPPDPPGPADLPVPPAPPKPPAPPGGGSTGGGSTGGGGATYGPRTGGAAVAKATLRYRSGRIAIKVRCTGSSTCTGTVRVLKGRTIIGSRSYRVRAGRSATVRVKPTSRGRAILSRARRHRVAVQLRPRKGRVAVVTLSLRR